jgi:hypothetical protein
VFVSLTELYARARRKAGVLQALRATLALLPEEARRDVLFDLLIETEEPLPAAAPSLHLSPPRIAGGKEEAITAEGLEKARAKRPAPPKDPLTWGVKFEALGQVGLHPSRPKEVTKPPEMGSGSAKREVVSNPAPVRARRSDFRDLTGQSFGTWTVIDEAPSDEHGRVYWNARHTCGGLAVLRGIALRNKPPKKCDSCRGARSGVEVVSNSAPKKQPTSDIATSSGKGNQRGAKLTGNQKDRIGTRIAGFVALECVGIDKRRDSLWFFRCEGCGETRTWSSNVIGGLLRTKSRPRCACKPPARAAGAEATEAPSAPAALPAEAPARAAAPADRTAPLATDEERTAPPRNPRLSGLSTLVGLKFGTWKVVARAGGALGMTYWKCHCSKCGAHKEIAALGAHGLRTRPPACGKCRLRSGAKPDEREGAEEEAAE